MNVGCRHLAKINVLNLLEQVEKMSISVLFNLMICGDSGIKELYVLWVP